MQASCHLCLTSHLSGWTSLELGEDFWKSVRSSWAALLFGTVSHKIIPDRSHNRAKSVLPKNRVVILLLAFLSSCRKLAGPSSHGHYSNSCPEAQQIPFPCHLLNHLYQKVVTDALQKPLGLLVSCKHWCGQSPPWGTEPTNMSLLPVVWRPLLQYHPSQSTCSSWCKSSWLAQDPFPGMVLQCTQQKGKRCRKGVLGKYGYK